MSDKPKEHFNDLLASIGIDASQLLACSDVALNCVLSGLMDTADPSATSSTQQETCAEDESECIGTMVALLADPPPEHHPAVTQRMFSLPPRSSCVVVPVAMVPSMIGEKSSGESGVSGDVALVTHEEATRQAPSFLQQLCVDGQQQSESQAPTHYDFPHNMMLRCRFPSSTAASALSDKAVEHKVRQLFLGNRGGGKDESAVEEEGYHYRPLDVLGELDRDLGIKKEALRQYNAFHAFHGTGHRDSSASKPALFLSRSIQPF